MNNKEDTLKWFEETARSIIEDGHGLFCTYYYIHDDRHDPYSFTIGYVPYSCGMCCSCDDCPHRNEYGECGEESLYIQEDGTIYYTGSNKTYTPDEFDNLLSEFY